MPRRSEKATQLCKEIEEKVNDLLNELFPMEGGLLRDCVVITGRAIVHEDHIDSGVSVLPMNEDMPDYTAIGMMSEGLNMYNQYHGVIDEDGEDEHRD